MHYADLTELLPHRDPFLFVDSIETATRERIIGYKSFTKDEYFFKGHFPSYPVVPGVILVETMAQCGGAGMKIILENNADMLFFLAGIEKAKFRKQIRPGDTVKIVIENIRLPENPSMIKQKGVCYLDEAVAAEAEWTCIVSRKE